MAGANISSSNSHKLAGLDHLRALAIILVLLFHYRLFGHPEWIESAGRFGWTGVDLFFVLSGYLIAGQLFKQIAAGHSISLRDFFVKRFFRIIPAYLFIVSVYFCVPAFHEREGLSPLWKYLTFTQNFGLDLRYYGTFSHAWSLCVEEQFYLLLPVIVLACVLFKIGRNAAIIIAALFIAGFFIRSFNWHTFVKPFVDEDIRRINWYKWIYYPTFNRLDGLLTGITVAGLCQFYPMVKKFIHNNGNLFFVAALIVLAGAYFVCLDPLTYSASVFGFPLVAIGYGCLLAAAISPLCFLYKIRSRVTASIATLSYSIYLSHKGLFHVTQELFAKLGVQKDSIPMIFLCLAVAILGAILLRYLVEKPFLKIKDRLLQKM